MNGLRTVFPGFGPAIFIQAAGWLSPLWIVGGLKLLEARQVAVEPDWVLDFVAASLIFCLVRVVVSGLSGFKKIAAILLLTGSAATLWHYGIPQMGEYWIILASFYLALAAIFDADPSAIRVLVLAFFALLGIGFQLYGLKAFFVLKASLHGG